MRLKILFAMSLKRKMISVPITDRQQQIWSLFTNISKIRSVCEAGGQSNQSALTFGWSRMSRQSSSCSRWGLILAASILLLHPWSDPAPRSFEQVGRHFHLWSLPRLTREQSNFMWKWSAAAWMLARRWPRLEPSFDQTEGVSGHYQQLFDIHFKFPYRRF